MRSLEEFQVLSALPQQSLADPFESVTVPESGDQLVALEKRERRVGFVQASVVALGLLALALALPLERLVHPGPSYVRWTDQGAWAWVHLALFPLARALSPWLGNEPAWFAVSAITWAASIPLVSLALQGFGYSRTRALVSTTIAVLAPGAAIAATVPGPYGPTLFGAALILFGLTGDPSADRIRLARRCAMAWFFACLFHLGHAMLFPVIVAAVATRRSGPGTIGAALIWLVTAPIALVSLLMVADLLPSVPTEDGFLRTAVLAMMGGPGEVFAKPLSGLLPLVPGLGMGLMGLVALLLPPASRGEPRPPAWIGLWLVAFLFSGTLFGLGTLGVGATGILPIAALGFGHAFGRLNQRRTIQRAALLGALQVVAMIGALVFLREGNPDRAWVGRTADLFEEGDLFLSRDANHLYLAEHRFGVESLDLREPVEIDSRHRRSYWRLLARRIAEANEGDRRVVLDAGLKGSLAAIHEFSFDRELHRLGLEAPFVRLEHLAAQRRYDRQYALQRDDLLIEEAELFDAEASAPPPAPPAVEYDDSDEAAP